MQLTEAPTLTFEEWEAGLIERYSILRQVVKEKLPDAWEPLEFTLSILMILNIKGNTLPFAGILLGNPSSCKTVGIEILRGWSNTYYSDDFTPKAFVSHNTSVKKEELKKIDMLPRIKDKVFLAPELAPLFNKREEDLTEILAILIRILDGHGYSSDSGAHGHREYVGEYMFTMVGASVDIPYRVYKILGNLGPKLYFLRLKSKTKSDNVYLSQMKNDTFSEDILEVQKLANQYLRWFEQCPTAETIEKKSVSPDLPPEYMIKIGWDSDKDDIEAQKKIVELGKLLSYLRGVIPIRETRDSQGIDYAYTIAIKENPERAMKQLYNLARGHGLLEGRNYITKNDVPLLVQVVLSTASRERVSVFEALLNNSGKLTTSEIKKKLNTTNNTAKKTMAEFIALGLVKDIRLGEEENAEHQIQLYPQFNWFLSEEFSQLRDR